MKIIDVELDIAGKYRAKVQLDGGDCVFLKFQTEPTEEEILSAVEEKAVLEAEAARIAKIEQQVREELAKEL